jgi:hypothetical protein
VVDINHDGFPDVCGRNSQGILCDLQIVDLGYNRFCNATDLLTGYPGCNLYGFDFGDNLGWNSSPAYWSTIQFADINGDQQRHNRGYELGIRPGRSLDPSIQ